MQVGSCSDMNILQLLFPNLEAVEIDYCSKLEDVVLNLEDEALVSPTIFPRDKLQLYHLSEVQIVYCVNLMKVTCLIYAPNLKYLCIAICHSLEEMIEVEEWEVAENGSKGGLFSRLTYLRLWDLPKLKSICKLSLPFPSLKVMDVKASPNLRKLPFDPNITLSDNLVKILGEEEWWERLKWENQTIKDKLTPYFNQST